MDKLTLQLFEKLEQRIRDVDLRQGGPRGPKGRKGDNGSVGPQGPQGIAGQQGPSGATGAAGRNGKDGAVGRPGVAGKQGPQGLSGAAGSNGLHGTDGRDGISVLDANIGFDGNLTLHLSDGGEIDAGKVVTDEAIAQIVYTSSGGLPDYWKDLVNGVIEDLNDHLNDFNNPHQTNHLNLTDNPNVRAWTNNPHETTLVNLDDTSIDLTNLNEGQGLWYDADTGLWKNRGPISEAFPTGLADGGELNIVAGTDVEVVGPGIALLMDSYTNPLAPATAIGLEWPTNLQEAITAAPAAAGSIVWVSLANSGIPSTTPTLPDLGIPINSVVLKQYAIPPGPSLARAEVFLGVLVHNGIEWKEVSNPKVINQTAETLREVATTVLPLTSIISGGEVSEIPSFELEQAEGVVWENNRNWHVDKSNPNREALPASSPILFQYADRNFNVSAPTSTVDNDTWDNNGVVEAIPGSGNTATIQRLYLDPANNYWVLYGQKLYPDFLTAQANLNAYNPVVPFLLENSILLGSIVAEKAPLDWTVDEAVFLPTVAGGASSGSGGPPISEFINLNDTPPTYTAQARKVPQVNDGEALLEFDYRNKYIDSYTIGPTYYPQEWVTDQEFISIANTETTDNAFPQNVGPPQRTYPDPAPFLTAANTSQVRSGHQYTFTASGLIQQLLVWVPELTDDIRYSLVVIVDPNGSPSVTRTDLENSSLNVDAWTLVVAGSTLYTVGTEIIVYLESQNFGSSTQVTGGWISEGAQNIAAPPAQNWNHNNAQDIVRIDKTDLNTTDRTSELLGIVSGSTIVFAETATPTNSRTYLVLATPVDLGTYIEYSVSLQSSSGSIPDGNISTMTADVPVSQSTEFAFETDKWLNDTPTWANIESFLQYDDVTQAPGPNTGYGIDIQFQELVASPDWDLIALGGGGGGGGGDFTPETFLGAGTTGYVPDPVTADGKYLMDDGTWTNTIDGGTF